MSQLTRRHHFVPQCLMRPWVQTNAGGNDAMLAFSWDHKKQALRRRWRSPEQVCFLQDLLLLRQHGLGRDVLEAVFFQSIDDAGARARDVLLADGAAALSGDQRCDFARLLQSLAARRPENVARLRTEGTATLRSGLDTDPEIVAAFAARGINEMPSEFHERQHGVFLSDAAVLMVQGMVDNPMVGAKLINAAWFVRHFRPAARKLILADRPLIRTSGYDKDGTIWFLPLTPSALFIAANHQCNMGRLMAISDGQLRAQINIASALHVERFAFSVDKADEKWLGTHLRPRTGS